MKNIDFKNYELLFIWCFVSVILLNKTNVIDEKISEKLEWRFYWKCFTALIAHMWAHFNSDLNIAPIPIPHLFIKLQQLFMFYQQITFLSHW